MEATNYLGMQYGTLNMISGPLLVGKVDIVLLQQAALKPNYVLSKPVLREVLGRGNPTLY
ncbi:hypothetical protein [Haloferax chudinovii]|uniref:Uncharacterized protein n=1 Tax=Haloferax chudinovii TaxID=1109010 RepID=A0ABD5XB34_9EURY